MTLAADLWEEKKYLKDLPIFSFPHLLKHCAY